MVVLFFFFFKQSAFFSKGAVSIYIPINNARKVHFLHTLTSIYCLWIFLVMAILLVWGYTHHFSFDLDFSNNEQCWAFFFMCLLTICLSSLGILPIIYLFVYLFIFNWFVCFPDTELHELFMYFGDHSFVSWYIVKWIISILSIIFSSV